MSEIKKYRRKPDPVEAVQVTLDNVEEVARWCGGRVVCEFKAGDPSDVAVWVTVATLEGLQNAHTTHPTTYVQGVGYTGGHYVVKDDQGRFRVMQPPQFEAIYEREES